MDDCRIIELYNARDEEALSASAEKYGRYCYSVAQNILSDRQDCEECVNDTWFNAWNAIPPQQPRSLKLFFARITRNLSFNRFKASQRLKRGGGEICSVMEEIGEFLSDGTRVEDSLEEEILLQLIHVFLRSLPRRECDMFVRRYFYVDTTKILAVRYGMGEDAVLRSLSRTRQKLKRYLEEEGYTL
ncbi:MAG: sigma-70 family RNA polymerase sigma factor [Clostridia bacterium]|nr:sigma-70 family RNA polymerase sigma factor [Clostridia bacterium]MBQ4323870.1 sigma-70 family RNA polymerase sigma factor [Clostridia bacterium]